MKNTLFIVLAVATLLSASACKKKDEFKTAPAVIKSVSNSSGTTISYSYDANGRVTEINNTNGTKTTIAYNADTVSESSSLAGVVLSIKTIVLSNGLAVSSVTTDLDGTITGYSDYSFDSNGYLTLQTNYNANHEYTDRKEYGINDGDIKVWTNRDTLTNENNFEYYYDHYYIPQTNTVSSPFLG
jgi:YD repeat-containing protein